MSLSGAEGVSGACLPLWSLGSGRHRSMEVWAGLLDTAPGGGAAAEQGVRGKGQCTQGPAVALDVVAYL